MTDCTFEGNSASNDGGAINNNDGDMIVTDCTFNDNTALGTLGGGRLGEQDEGGARRIKDGDLTLTDSTLEGNNATYGGAIYRASGDVTLTSCTLEGNTACVSATGSHHKLGGLADDGGSRAVGCCVWWGEHTPSAGTSRWWHGDQNEGGAVFDKGCGKVELLDCLFTDNVPNNITEDCLSSSSSSSSSNVVLIPVIVSLAVVVALVGIYFAFCRSGNAPSGSNGVELPAKPAQFNFAPVPSNAGGGIVQVPQQGGQFVYVPQQGHFVQALQQGQFVQVPQQGQFVQIPQQQVAMVPKIVPQSA